MNIIERAFLSVYSRSFVHLHKKTAISVNTLFNTEIMSRFHHPLVALRYLAIENYFKENVMGFDLYRNIGSGYISEAEMDKDIERFIALIKSFESNGYNGSPLIMDKTGNIVNGTHRLALLIYFSIPTVNVCTGFIVRESAGSATAAIKRLGIGNLNIEQLEEAYHRIYVKLNNI